MRCPVIELLTEIRDRLRNLDTLEIQREKARLRMRAKRATQRDVREQENVREQKEDEKGKETFPPAPPIENKGKVEETRTNIARARARFVPPTPEEVAAFCLERRNSVDPVLWWNFYAAKGWMIGKAKMVDWKRAVITWERTQKQARRVAPIDPKAAAFERQRAEAEERRRNAEALAASILERRQAILAHQLPTNQPPTTNH